MIAISDYIKNSAPFDFSSRLPWELSSQVKELIEATLKKLNSDFIINGNVAIHKSATIEQGVVLKGPIIISQNCFVGAHAYLRGGVFLSDHVSIGPGCEIKSSFIFSNSALAHFNFVGDSILGSHINMEAGAIVANHYNERSEKEITVLINGIPQRTGSEKFGSLVGDGVKIGANAVLSPGTLLHPYTIVDRLSLIRQI